MYLYFLYSHLRTIYFALYKCIHSSSYYYSLDSEIRIPRPFNVTDQSGRSALKKERRVGGVG